MTLKEKLCLGCTAVLPRSAFYVRKKNGHIIGMCKECEKQKRREWSAAHRQQVAAYKLRYREPRRALEAEKSREYIRTHKAERNAKLRLRIRTDPRFAIERLLRHSLADAVRLAVTKKAASTFKLLGCSIVEFMTHIEKQWTLGMSWENWGAGRGKWNLDHIRPIASFDLTKPEDQKDCFRWSNFQPLWMVDNVRKKDRWTSVAA